MIALSETLNPDSIAELRRRVAGGTFPGISFEQAMAFLLTDGIFPESDLPLESFYALEEWARGRLRVGGGELHGTG